MPKREKLYINGIDGRTGQYLLKPLGLKDLTPFITGEPDKNLLLWLQRIMELVRTDHMGFWDRNPADITQVGWGVVFHDDESAAVKAALEPLIRHRRSQMVNKDLVKTFTFHANEQFKEWLGRNGLAPGSKDPETIPYYLLLVGSPERIPFLFGHLLDIEYGVGRLDFDRPEDYAAYVSAVIAYEKAASLPNSREAVLFGTRHPFDGATQLSADKLVKPLAVGIPARGVIKAKPPVTEGPDFQQRGLLGAKATKAALGEVFAPPAGSKPPAFLFTASHGLGWPAGDDAQLDKQGALLCQDWPGFGNINPAHYFAASDLPANAQANGMITFHFACYGAGTPATDRYLHRPGVQPPKIADKPFIAALPKALLTHGALAVIGHVERAWDYSISTPEAGAQIGPFRTTIESILNGLPVGFALKDFNERYAALSASLNALIETRSTGGTVMDDELAANWVERNDSEGYVIVGDPAVHLRSELLK